jgi:hypothetical protein
MTEEHATEAEVKMAGGEASWRLPLPQPVRTDMVLKLLAQGVPVAEIADRLLRDYCTKVPTRDMTYQDVARGTKKRLIGYAEPDCQRLERELRATYPATRERNFRDLLVVPGFGESLGWVAAGARLCAEAVANIALDKARKITRGEPPESTEPHSFTALLRDSESPTGFRTKPVKDLTAKELADAEVVPMKVPVRVAFSGGRTAAGVAQALADAVSVNLAGWEERLKARVLRTLEEMDARRELADLVVRRFRVEFDLTFYNLVAGFDLDAGSNPIAFLPALLRDPRLAARCKVKLFNAMPFVEVGQGRKTIDEVPVLREIRDDWERFGFDITITSCGCLGDPHSTFRRYARRAEDPGQGLGPDICEVLRGEGVRGDFLFQPITREGPLKLGDLKQRLLQAGDTARAAALRYEPMCLLGLDDIAKVVAGKHIDKISHDVFFFAGPCSVCGLDKSEVVDAVLRQLLLLASHVVLERATAEAALALAQRKAG